jgi:TRAP-type uncharacterized transport system fused permease subunit
MGAPPLELARLIALIEAVTKSLAELAALLAGVGLIIGALSVTGLAGTLANDLVYIAGNNIYVLLVMGAVTSFIFGMGMTITACYIFLAIVLAPPLIKAGFDPVAVHLFMLYWGMVSFITPPVALASFVAAGVARAAPLQVGLQSMRLGSTMYFVPFFFVLNPALIMRGEAAEIAVVVATAIAGIWLIAAALEGYLAGFGVLGKGLAGVSTRALLLVAGLSMALPGGGELELSHLQLSIAGLGLAATALLLAALMKRLRSAPRRPLRPDTDRRSQTRAHFAHEFFGVCARAPGTPWPLASATQSSAGSSRRSMAPAWVPLGSPPASFSSPCRMR